MGNRADGQASGMRGRLSEVLLGGLCDGEIADVLLRLGGRAGVDEPIFGASRGDDTRAHVEKLAAWLSERAARFEQAQSVVGTSVDVTFGTLFLGPEGARQGVPAAVVVERKREREVDVRLHVVTPSSDVRGPHLPEAEVALSGVVADAFEALNGRDHAPCFETRARLRGALGEDSAVADHAPLKLSPHGVALDARSAAIEVRSAQGVGLVVLERGLGGLVRAVRLYGAF